MIWQQAPLSCAQTKLRVLLAASLQPSFSGAGVAEWLEEGQEGQRQGSRLADPRRTLPKRLEHHYAQTHTTRRSQLNTALLQPSGLRGSLLPLPVPLPTHALRRRILPRDRTQQQPPHSEPQHPAFEPHNLRSEHHQACVNDSI